MAVKNDPKLWQEAKRRACYDAAMCKHSARAMQWATHWYKSRGGMYKGRRDPGNKLTVWTRQKWRTESGAPSAGRLRYLPDRAWDALSPDQRRRTNAAKVKGMHEGRQYVPQPEDVKRIAATFRKPSSRGNPGGKKKASANKKSKFASPEYMARANERAKRLGVTVKRSTRRGKKLDVFDGSGKKVASIGDTDYEDFLQHGDKERRTLYKKRHERDRHVFNSGGYYADRILW